MEKKIKHSTKWVGLIQQSLGSGVTVSRLLDRPIIQQNFINSFRSHQIKFYLYKTINMREKKYYVGLCSIFQTCFFFFFFENPESQEFEFVLFLKVSSLHLGLTYNTHALSRLACESSSIVLGPYIFSFLDIYCRAYYSWPF